jgi:hypothetical protein
MAPNQVFSTTLERKYFRKLNKNRVIQFQMKNIINLQFPNAPGLFVNCKNYQKSGGIDPVMSDIGLAAKLTYYYSTFLLPQQLYLNQNTSDAKSLQQSFSNSFLIAGYKLVEAICKSLGYPTYKAQTKASWAANLAEIAAKGYNDTNYQETKLLLNMKPFYNTKIVLYVSSFLQKLNWVKLLFQKM